MSEIDNLVVITCVGACNTYIHIYVNTYIHIYTHTQIQTYIHTHTHTATNPWTMVYKFAARKRNASTMTITLQKPDGTLTESTEETMRLMMDNFTPRRQRAGRQ